MAKKGEILTRINVDLGKALRDWMDVHGNPPPGEMARLLHLKPQESGRIKEILEGGRNTQLFMERLVKYLFSGDYNTMLKYAKDQLAQDRIQELALIETFKGLSKERQQLVIEARRIQRELLLNGKLQEVYKALKALKE